MTTTTKTVKSAAGDYSTLSGWEAGQQKVISAGDIEAAECYAFQDTTQITIDGWTTVATGYIRIYTPSAERHTGVLSSGYRLVLNPAFDTVLRINEDFVRLEGIAVRHSTSAFNASERAIFNSNAGGTRDIRITECLVTGGITSIESSGGVLKAINTIVFGGTNGISTSGGATNPNDAIYNCTVSATTNGITTDGSGTSLVKNCYSTATTCYSASGQTRTTCAHSTATAHSGSTASIAYDTSNFTNVTAGSQNLHLASGASSTLKTGGTDLSADATYAFSTDIDGESRSDWGIGADEFISAGGASVVPIIDRQFRARWL